MGLIYTAIWGHESDRKRDTVERLNSSDLGEKRRYETARFTLFETHSLYIASGDTLTLEHGLRRGDAGWGPGLVTFAACLPPFSNHISCLPTLEKQITNQ